MPQIGWRTDYAHDFLREEKRRKAHNHPRSFHTTYVSWITRFRTNEHKRFYEKKNGFGSKIFQIFVGSHLSFCVRCGNARMWIIDVSIEELTYTRKFTCTAGANRVVVTHHLPFYDVWRTLTMHLPGYSFSFSRQSFLVILDAIFVVPRQKESKTSFWPSSVQGSQHRNDNN